MPSISLAVATIWATAVRNATAVSSSNTSLTSRVRDRTRMRALFSSMPSGRNVLSPLSASASFGPANSDVKIPAASLDPARRTERNRPSIALFTRNTRLLPAAASPVGWAPNCRRWSCGISTGAASSEIEQLAMSAPAKGAERMRRVIISPSAPMPSVRSRIEHPTCRRVDLRPRPERRAS